MFVQIPYGFPWFLFGVEKGGKGWDRWELGEIGVIFNKFMGFSKAVSVKGFSTHGHHFSSFFHGYI